MLVRDNMYDLKYIFVSRQDWKFSIVQHILRYGRVIIFFFFPSADCGTLRKQRLALPSHPSKKTTILINFYRFFLFHFLSKNALFALIKLFFHFSYINLFAMPCWKRKRGKKYGLHPKRHAVRKKVYYVGCTSLAFLQPMECSYVGTRPAFEIRPRCLPLKRKLDGGGS